jgi:small subunit ribosomal protein S10
MLNYHYLEFSRLTESTLKTYLEYIQRNLPEGVAMRVTKPERKPLPDVIVNTIKNEALI